MTSPPSATAPVEWGQKLSLWEKCKAQPSVPIGVAGMCGVVGYGIYGYRNRKGMSTSLYILRFRVIAQGAVIGSMTLGVAYSIGQTLLERYRKKESKSE